MMVEIPSFVVPSGTVVRIVLDVDPDGNYLLDLRGVPPSRWEEVREALLYAARLVPGRSP